MHPKWTPTQDSDLVALRKANWSFEKISPLVDHTAAACATRYSALYPLNGKDKKVASTVPEGRIRPIKSMTEGQIKALYGEQKYTDVGAAA